MTEDYALHFQSIEAYYQDILQKVHSGNSNQVSSRELRNTQNLIDQMLSHIEDVQAQGVDIDKLMQYQDQFQQLYREYDYAGKHKVRKQEFEASLMKVLKVGQQRLPSNVHTPSGPIMTQRPESFPPPMNPNDPFFMRSLAQPAIGQPNPFNREAMQLPLMPSNQMQGQMFGIQGQPMQQNSLNKIPEADPWKNPVPQYLASSGAPILPEHSQRVVFPDGQPLHQTQPPMNTVQTIPSSQSVQSSTDRNRNFSDPYNNKNPWSGPPTIDEARLPQKVPLGGINNSQQQQVVGPNTSNLFQTNSNIRSNGLLITQPGSTKFEQQTLPQPPTSYPTPRNIQTVDPWLNEDSVPPQQMSTFRNPSFGMPSNIPKGSLLIPQTSERQIPPQSSAIKRNGREMPLSQKSISKQQQMYLAATRIPIIPIEGTVGDPWENTNPWSNPPTIVTPGVVSRQQKSKLSNTSSARFRGEGSLEGGSGENHALTDSIYGKLYTDGTKQISPKNSLEQIGEAAVERSIRQQQTDGSWYPSPNRNKPETADRPSPSFPGVPYGMPGLPTNELYRSYGGNELNPNCPPPPMVIAGVTNISNQFQSKPPPVLLETHVTGPPVIVAESVIQLTNNSNQRSMIPQSIAPPSMPPPDMRANNSSVRGQQKLSADEQLIYRRRLDELFSLPGRYQNLSFKSEMERSVSNHSRKSKSPFQKKRVPVQDKQSLSVIAQLKYENEELKNRLKANSQLIVRNNSQILRQSQAGGVVVDSLRPIQEADRMDILAARLFEQTQNPHQNPQANTLSKRLFDNITAEPPRLQIRDPTNIEKYIISNQMLQKENEQIRKKINELEEVLEELAKQNMQLREAQRSAGHGSASSPINRQGKIHGSEQANPQSGAKKVTREKESSEDSIIKSIGVREFVQPKIRPVEYVHTDGSVGTVAVAAGPIRENTIALPSANAQTSLQNLPQVTPILGPSQHALDNGISSQSSPFKIQEPFSSSPTPLRPTQPPMATVGLSSIPRFDSSDQLPGSANPQAFMSMHNTSHQYNNTSLWINQKSIMEKNEEERLRSQNKYILPPTTNDLNKVNSLNPNYEFPRLEVHLNDRQLQQNVSNGSFKGFNNPVNIQRSINPNVMPPSMQQIPASTREVNEGIVGSALKPQVQFSKDIPPNQATSFNQYRSQQQLSSMHQEPIQANNFHNAANHEAFSTFSSRPQLASNPNDLPLDFNQREDYAQRSFDTFKLVDTMPESFSSFNKVEHDSIQSPLALLNTTSGLLLRNKVAFFKKSLVLVRNDPNFEIAFKRSSLSPEMDTIRFIFYINNKSDRDATADIAYEYDQSMYQLKTNERLRSLKAGKQGREEITINLKDDSRRSFSFIVCHITLDSTSYDILLPVLFFNFVEGLTKVVDHYSKSLTIIPNKQFSAPHFMYTLMPVTYINDEEEVEYLKGEKPYKTEITVVSKKGRSPLRMDWFQGLIKITGDERWVDMVGWLLADIRL